MGYSSRYHAASLLAVFIALAVGILIGIGLADDVVTTASQEVEDSLKSDLDEAQADLDAAAGELEREREFGERAFPALVAGRLTGSSVAVIGLGDLPQESAADVQDAVEAAGADVGAVGVVSLPVDAESLSGSAGPGYASARRDDERLAELGADIGAGLIGGDRLVSRVQQDLFSRFSGSFGDVDRVVLVPTPPSDLEEDQQARDDAFLGGLYDGVRSAAAGAAGAEGSGVDPSNLEPVREAGLPTVDHVDLDAGKVALVFALLGAGGDYGVKEGADRFLPELLPAAGSGPAARQGQQQP